MMPRRLDRYVLGMGFRQWFFSLAVLTLVLVAGLVAPLVGRGANWLDVLVYLPSQIALPMTLTLPVAVMSAAALVVAGMVESRELVALASVGIPHRRVVLALLPLALLASLLTAWLSHIALPRAMQAFREARSELVSQALAVRVARQEPIIEKDGAGVIVMACDESEVFDVIGHKSTEEVFTVAFAPRGVILTEPDAQGQRFDFDLHDVRALRVEGRGEDARFTHITLPRAGSELVLPRRASVDKPDVLSTEQLGLTIPWLQAVVNGMEMADDDAVLWPLLLDPLQPSLVDGPALSAGEREQLLSGSLRQMLADDARRELVLAIGRARRAGIDHRCDLLVDWSHGLGLQTSVGSARTWLLPRLQTTLRKMELNWHMRWALACCPITLWLLGCGLGLRLSLNNHTLVPMLAIACMLLAAGPSIGLVDGLRHRLILSPAWFLWPVQGLYAMLGCWWLRRL